jgi:hypothetical protein
MTMLIFLLSAVVSYTALASYLEEFSHGSSQMYQYINKNFAAYDLESAEALRLSLLSSSSSAGYGIMNTGCLNHAISSSNLFNKIVSSTADEYLSIHEALSLYLSELSRSRASKSAWVMTWTDGCHDIGCVNHCAASYFVSDSSGINGKHKSLWLGFIVIIVSVGSILFFLAIWYLVCYRSCSKKLATGEGIYDPHNEHFPAMQTFPPAPALDDEFSSLLSSTQAFLDTTAAVDASGSISAISANDSDLDSFFDNLNRPVKKFQ